MKTALLSTALILATSTAFAAGHAMAPGVMASDQEAVDGTVTADEIVTAENGWLVVHRTDADMKPGPVVGHAPLRKGANTDVVAILNEPVAAGDMLMLMIHSEAGGTMPGIFEYTLGAKEDGPIRIDEKLVMSVITLK